MRKEIILVILVGITIGAVVTFGIYTAQTAINDQETEQVEETTPTNTPTQSEQDHIITIISPANESISETDTTTLIGKTSPDSVIAIIAQDSEYLLTADKQGDFTADINLTGGANLITISSFDELGNKAEEVLTVVYSTADL